MTRTRRKIIGGVDTHACTHHAAVIDLHGRLLDDAEFAASPAGYGQMLSWMRKRGQVQSVGIEGTGAYGAGLARHLHEYGVEVLEVPRPDRRLRRQRGKSDPIDAEAAARTVLAGNASGAPKLATGPIEAIRMLRVARTGAVKAKTAAANTLQAVLVTAPEPLRGQLRALSTAKLIDACLRLRPDSTSLHDPVQAAKMSLRSIAIRARTLDAEARALKKQLDALTAVVAPATSAIFGLGPDTVSALLIAVGDNPDRLRSEAAALGQQPGPPSPTSARPAPESALPCRHDHRAFLPATGQSDSHSHRTYESGSGHYDRVLHQLSRGGNRQINRTLHLMAVVQLRDQTEGRAYFDRKVAARTSSMDAMRCYKRRPADAVYRQLLADSLGPSGRAREKGTRRRLCTPARPT